MELEKEKDRVRREQGIPVHVEGSQQAAVILHIAHKRCIPLPYYNKGGKKDREEGRDAKQARVTVEATE